jgi:ferredoxin-NADP reductase
VFDADYVKEQIDDIDHTVFYACGPNPLVEFAETLVLDKMAVPKEQMKVEKWG